MANDFKFTNDAWDDFCYWLDHNKKMAKKIRDLMKSIPRDGLMQGIGKPESLKYRPGYSRRIDDENRVVYDTT